jgi:hypothetical protein
MSAKKHRISGEKSSINDIPENVFLLKYPLLLIVLLVIRIGKTFWRYEYYLFVI